MKKWLGLVLGLIIAVTVVAPVSASPARVLTRDIMDRFLRDFPLVQAEVEALETDLTEELSEFQMEDSGLPSLESIKAGIMAVMLNPEVSAILARYGWTEVYMETYVVVITGYSLIVFQELYLAYPLPELKEVLAQLEPGLHPDDLALLKEYRTRIEMVLGIDMGI
jgi:hypothetical protein